MALLGLFSLFGRSEPQRCYLDGLGELVSERDGYWNGQAPFRPLGRALGVAVKSPQEPPGADAARFFRQVEARWPALWPAVGQTLFDGATGLPDGISHEQLFASLCVEALEFWSLAPGEESWEITCTTPLDPRHFCIEMLGWEEQGFRTDG